MTEGKTCGSVRVFPGMSRRFCLVILTWFVGGFGDSMVACSGNWVGRKADVMVGYAESKPAQKKQKKKGFKEMKTSLVDRIRHWEIMRLAVSFTDGYSLQNDMQSKAFVYTEVGPKVTSRKKAIRIDGNRVVASIREEIRAGIGRRYQHLSELFRRMEIVFHNIDASRSVTEMYRIMNDMMQGVYFMRYSAGDIFWLTEHLRALFVAHILVEHMADAFDPDTLGYPNIIELRDKILPDHTRRGIRQMESDPQINHPCVSKLLEDFRQFYDTNSQTEIPFNLGACLAGYAHEEFGEKSVHLRFFLNEAVVSKSIPDFWTPRKPGQWDLPSTDISQDVVPPYRVDINRLTSRISARFYGESQPLPVPKTLPVADQMKLCLNSETGAALQLMSSLKSFSDCKNSCQPGCAWDTKMKVFRPTRPGHYSAGGSGECLEIKCPVYSDVMYNRGGLQRLEDCLDKGAACIGTGRIMKEGRCISVEPGFVSEMCSDRVTQCPNKQDVEKLGEWSNVNMWPGTCMTKLEEGGLKVRLAKETQAYIANMRFSVDFQVSMKSDQWSVQDISSTRIFGVKNRWRFELAKTSTPGLFFPTLYIQNQPYRGTAIQLIADENHANVFKGRFKWVVMGTHTYIMYENMRVVVTGHSTSDDKAWLDQGQDFFMVGPEDAYSRSNWDYEVVISKITGGAGFSTKYLESRQSFRGQFEGAWPSEVFIVENENILARRTPDGDPMRFSVATVQAPVVDLNGWPGLGTQPGDWPVSTDPLNFFFGKSVVDVEELKMELSKPCSIESESVTVRDGVTPDADHNQHIGLSGISDFDETSEEGETSGDLRADGDNTYSDADADADMEAKNIPMTYFFGDSFLAHPRAWIILGIAIATSLVICILSKVYSVVCAVVKCFRRKIPEQPSVPPLPILFSDVVSELSIEDGLAIPVSNLYSGYSLQQLDDVRWAESLFLDDLSPV